MEQPQTTIVIQRYLDALPEDAESEKIVRELLERSVSRLRMLCARFLHQEYSRLTRGPFHMETDELLGGVVAGLIVALKKTRPPTVRRFFALANQHIRWQLNDLARRLDERPEILELAESGVMAPAESTIAGGLGTNARRILEAIGELPKDEQEVFELVGIQGLTHAEAAEIVGSSEKTIQRRLNRARLLLADKLSDFRNHSLNESALPANVSPQE
jgi:RNA polymerase sigma factor (sigma-70 family)